MPKFNLRKIVAPVRKIARQIKERRAELQAEMNELDKALRQLMGEGRTAKATTPSESGKRRKRSRRSREELVEVAGQIVEFIKGKGKEGASAKDITAKFGTLLPSPNAWLKMYSPVKVKTTGVKSKMRYFA